jgi:NADPH2:quinone reductase
MVEARLTAMYSLPGDYVLVHGAAGGVGLAAIEIAKALGLTVIATANTAKKRAVAKRFGADYVVDSESDWVERVKACTPDKRGVDVVLDPLGLIEKSLKCTRWDGRLVVIGFAAGAIEKIAMNRLLLKNVSVSGLFWGVYATMNPHAVVRVWDELLKIIDRGGIKPLDYTEERFWGLEAVPMALKVLSTGQAWGKIVIDLSNDGTSKL